MSLINQSATSYISLGIVAHLSSLVGVGELFHTDMGDSVGGYDPQAGTSSVAFHMDNGGIGSFLGLVGQVTVAHKVLLGVSLMDGLGLQTLDAIGLQGPDDVALGDGSGASTAAVRQDVLDCLRNLFAGESFLLGVTVHVLLEIVYFFGRRAFIVHNVLVAGLGEFLQRGNHFDSAGSSNLRICLGGGDGDGTGLMGGDAAPLVHSGNFFIVRGPSHAAVRIALGQNDKVDAAAVTCHHLSVLGQAQVDGGRAIGGGLRGNHAVVAAQPVGQSIGGRAFHLVGVDVFKTIGRAVVLVKTALIKGSDTDLAGGLVAGGTAVEEFDLIIGASLILGGIGSLHIRTLGMGGGPLDGVDGVAGQSPGGGLNEGIAVVISLGLAGVGQLIDVVPQGVLTVLDGVPPVIEAFTVLVQQDRVVFHLEQQVIGQHGHLFVGVVQTVQNPVVYLFLRGVLRDKAILVGHISQVLPVFSAQVGVTEGLLGGQHLILIFPTLLTGDIGGQLEDVQNHQAVEGVVLPGHAVVEVVQVGLAPGGTLAGGIQQGVAVIRKMLSNTAHGVRDELLQLTFLTLVTKNIVGDLIDEEVADDLVGAGVGLVDDVVLGGVAQQVSQDLGNLTGGIHSGAGQIFPLHLGGSGLLAFCDLTVNVPVIAVVEVGIGILALKAVGTGDHTVQTSGSGSKEALVGVFVHDGPVFRHNGGQEVGIIVSHLRIRGASLAIIDRVFLVLQQSQALTLLGIMALVGTVHKRTDIGLHSAGAAGDVGQKQRSFDGVQSGLFCSFQFDTLNALVLQNLIAHQFTGAVHGSPQTVVVSLLRNPLLTVPDGLGDHTTAGHIFLGGGAHVGGLVGVGELLHADVGDSTGGYDPQAGTGGVALHVDDRGIGGFVGVIGQVAVAHKVLLGVALMDGLGLHALDAVDLQAPGDVALGDISGAAGAVVQRVLHGLGDILSGQSLVLGVAVHIFLEIVDLLGCGTLIIDDLVGGTLGELVGSIDDLDGGRIRDGGVVGGGGSDGDGAGLVGGDAAPLVHSGDLLITGGPGNAAVEVALGQNGEADAAALINHHLSILGQAQIDGGGAIGGGLGGDHAMVAAQPVGQGVGSGGLHGVGVVVVELVGVSVILVDGALIEGSDTDLAGLLVQRGAVGQLLIGQEAGDRTGHVGALGVAGSPLDGVDGVAGQSPGGSLDEGVAEVIGLDLVGIGQLIDVVPQGVLAVLHGVPPVIEADAVLVQQDGVVLQLEQQVVGQHGHLFVRVVQIVERPVVGGLAGLEDTIGLGHIEQALPVGAAQVSVAVGLLGGQHPVLVLPALLAGHVAGDLEDVEQNQAVEGAVLPGHAVVEVVQLGLSPGSALAGGVAERVAVIHKVLGQAVHGVGDQSLELSLFGVGLIQNVIGDLVDEEVANQLVGAGVGLIGDVALHGALGQDTQQNLGDLTGGVHGGAVVLGQAVGGVLHDAGGGAVLVDLPAVAAAVVLVAHGQGAGHEALQRAGAGFKSVLGTGEVLQGQVGPVLFHHGSHEGLVIIAGGGVGGAVLQVADAGVAALEQGLVQIPVAAASQRADKGLHCAGAAGDVGEEQNGLEGTERGVTGGLNLVVGGAGAFLTQHGIAHQFADAVHRGPQAVVVVVVSLPGGVGVVAAGAGDKAVAGDLLRGGAHLGGFVGVGELLHADMGDGGSGHDPKAVGVVALHVDDGGVGGILGVSGQIAVAHKVLLGVALMDGLGLHALDAVDLQGPGHVALGDGSGAAGAVVQRVLHGLGDILAGQSLVLGITVHVLLEILDLFSGSAVEVDDAAGGALSEFILRGHDFDGDGVRDAGIVLGAGRDGDGTGLVGGDPAPLVHGRHCVIAGGPGDAAVEVGLGQNDEADAAALVNHHLGVLRQGQPDGGGLVGRLNGACAAGAAAGTGDCGLVAGSQVLVAHFDGAVTLVFDLGARDGDGGTLTAGDHDLAYFTGAGHGAIVTGNLHGGHGAAAVDLHGRTGGRLTDLHFAHIGAGGEYQGLIAAHEDNGIRIGIAGQGRGGAGSTGGQQNGVGGAGDGHVAGLDQGDAVLCGLIGPGLVRVGADGLVQQRHGGGAVDVLVGQDSAVTGAGDAVSCCVSADSAGTARLAVRANDNARDNSLRAFIFFPPFRLDLQHSRGLCVRARMMAHPCSKGTY
ncbi:Uncharacterised protein [uncultured Flavonifractor sp.]|nr:Uncharacterised protein [uncultured Flavonifractor sp.]